MKFDSVSEAAAKAGISPTDIKRIYTTGGVSQLQDFYSWCLTLGYPDDDPVLRLLAEILQNRARQNVDVGGNISKDADDIQLSSLIIAA